MREHGSYGPFTLTEGKDAFKRCQELAVIEPAFNQGAPAIEYRFTSLLDSTPFLRWIGPDETRHELSRRSIRGPPLRRRFAGRGLGREPRLRIGGPHYANTDDAQL
jgi:hypothetical protein